uniref:XRE family transcriptional regulator n=1 Tax=Thermorudis peleae TaxID=1382356 RepID=A0A831X0P1_9BACT
MFERSPGLANRAKLSSPTLFGAELRRLREERGLSQSALARRARLDHTFISRLESGQREPSRESVEVLAAALGLAPPERQRLLGLAGLGLATSGWYRAVVERLDRTLADPALDEDARSLLSDLVTTAIDLVVKTGRR